MNRSSAVETTRRRAGTVISSAVVGTSALVWSGGLAAVGLGWSGELDPFVADTGTLLGALRGLIAITGLTCAALATALFIGSDNRRHEHGALLVMLAFGASALVDAAATATLLGGVATGRDAGVLPLVLWTVSRTVLGIALALVARNVLVGATKRAFIGLGLGVAVVAVVSSIAAFAGMSPPWLVLYGAVVPRPWDLPALLIFAITGLWLVPAMYRRRPTLLLQVLIASCLPLVLAQIESAFGAARIGQGHDAIAHLLALIAALGLMIALFVEMTARLRLARQRSLAFETTRQELSRQTEELMRVDRERILEEAKRRRAERFLQMLEKAIERMSIGVVISEPDGTLLYVNPAGASMHGYEPRELIGTRYELLAAVEDSVSAGPPEPLAGRPWVREQLSRTRDGNTFPARLVSDNVRDEEDRLTATVTCLEDITERRRVESMKQDFISTVSHELRTPLTSIVAALGLLEQPSLRGDPERLGELTGLAHRNSRRLLDLINDLLDIQRLSAGRLALESTAIDVLPLLDEAAAGMRAFAHERGVRIVVESEPGLVAIADRRRLVQVLLNLLSNAIKFSPEDAPVHLGGTDESDTVILSVSDRGPGIPETFRVHLFERFTQADASTARATGGSGLGLAIARQLVEAMGGSIEVETEEGRGTTFLVRLPRAESET